MTPASPDEVGRRLDRLESLEEIRQLVARYALALDMRDLDALCGLFPEDVQVGRGQRGRAALKAWFDETLRSRGEAHVCKFKAKRVDATPPNLLGCP